MEREKREDTTPEELARLVMLGEVELDDEAIEGMLAEMGIELDEDEE